MITKVTNLKNMISRSTIKHLRIPFSIFLMPVFLFALANVEQIDFYNTLIVFIVLHLFIYPASNGYNSYFDKDEGSIGGLKKPPKVTKNLYWTALIFDGLGIFLALFINIWFAIMVFIYGLISKAYSHPNIRLKKYAFASWLTVGLFQGAFTYFMSSSGLLDQGFEIWVTPKIYLPAILSTLLLLGSYPMTQIYQHEEDAARGDKTISLLVGIKGTFYLTAVMFSLSMLGFLWYYSTYFSLNDFYILLAFLAPVFGLFSFWFLKVLKNETAANFENTMRFNMISSTCLIVYFLFLVIG